MPTDIDSRKYAELEQLFGAYLHQDYDIEHGSLEDALRDYRDESSLSERGDALRQIDDLVSTYPADEQLYAALRKLGFGLAPQRDGQTASEWLAWARAILASPAQPPRRRR